MSNTIPNELKDLVLPAIEQQVQTKIEEAFKLALFAEDASLVQKAYDKVEEAFLNEAVTPDSRLESLNDTPEVIAARNLIPSTSTEEGFNLVTGNSKEEVTNIRKKALNNRPKRKCKKRGRQKSSSYKGVSFDKNLKKWRARITVRNKPIMIGLFEDEVVAAKAYDKTKFKYSADIHGLNFPNEFI